MLNLQLDSNHTKDVLNSVIAFVEATDEEKSYLWQDYSTDSFRQSIWKPKKTIEWKNNSNHSGWVFHIGDFGGEPIMVSIMLVDIGYRTVAFWHPTSKVVHYGMIAEWFEAIITNKKIIRTDSGSFHTVVDHILVVTSDD